MVEKSDEEIIKEVGLEHLNQNDNKESSDTISSDEEENLEPIKEDSSKEMNTENKAIENEDKDDIDRIKINQNLSGEGSINIQKKQPKIYKTLIVVATLLFLILATGTILYFTGFFNSEPVKVIKDENTVKKTTPEMIFNSKDLDKNSLNKKLTMLTKNEIMNKEELENEENKIRIEEKKKKEAEEKALLEKRQKEEAELAAQFEKIENEKKALQEHQKAIKDEQEQFLKMQEQAKLELEQTKVKLLKELATSKEKIETTEDVEIINNIPDMESEVLPVEDEELNETPQVEDETVDSKSFLSFINVATIKGNLYKSFLDEVQKYDKNISLCRDYKNRVEIYFGPYSSEKERKKVYDNLLDNGFKEAYLIDFTNEEYEKRCKY